MPPPHGAPSTASSSPPAAPKPPYPPLSSGTTPARSRSPNEHAPRPSEQQRRASAPSCAAERLAAPSKQSLRQVDQLINAKLREIQLLESEIETDEVLLQDFCGDGGEDDAAETASLVSVGGASRDGAPGIKRVGGFFYGRRYHGRAGSLDDILGTRCVQYMCSTGKRSSRYFGADRFSVFHNQQAQQEQFFGGKNSTTIWMKKILLIC